MAIEYNLDATPVMDAAAALDYFANGLGCDERFENPGFPDMAARKELQVTVLESASDDDPDMTALLGVDRLLSVTFRRAKFLSTDEATGIFRDMVAAAAAFFEDFPTAKGVRSFQNEDIYLQRLDDAIVLSERLSGPDFNPDGIMDGLLAKYPTREVGMGEDLLPDQP